ncbi:Gfo/Idh/MocA family protein [Legionella longbeachae]|uniref:Gfo/Idh/MocA family protein n=1 Tax=Legionella longbeachae TaxID=450 RepID=UPI0012440E71|nr:Gfo/Idh/MocA family oxidoreductase [Legionella longbeachae]QEY50048.1 Gfo/Idh/MocA family oxidoreductase [Legionella longbeachae]QEY50178.1 Gfo/Idh/MocA family oxidoreductase [Legionella longbeachae]
MVKKSIRWGIIGTSYISEVMARAIEESSTGLLEAIGSRSMLTAQTFAEKFAVPHYYDNYQAILDNPEVDVVYIGLPNHLHQEWIIRAALAGKHILCEKPLVMNVRELQEVIAITEESQVICMEALMYRSHPLTQKIKEIIRNKSIGEVKLYNATYTANIAEIANPIAGGCIRNLGCYPISLIRFLADAEPVEIKAMGRINPVSNNDNQASILLKFENDALAVVSTADDIEMYWQFDVYGTEGHLQVVTNPWLPTQDNNLLLVCRHNEPALEIQVAAEASLYSYQIDLMNHMILNGDTLNSKRISLLESYGTISVLETWMQQVKAQN